MKKIPFFALLSIFALATPSCNKEPTEIVDKTEYNVIILVEGRTIKTRTQEYGYTNYTYNDPEPLKNATITLLDYDKTLTTDRDGKATLKLQSGEYRITVEQGGDKYIGSYPSSGTSSDDDEIYDLDVYGNSIEQFTLYEKP